MIGRPRPYTLAEASRAKTDHVLVFGKGYFRAASPLRHGSISGSAAHPSILEADDSMHILKAPGGPAELVFKWVEKEKAWERRGGKRMAFKADYLSSHGWTYVRPAHDGEVGR